MHSTDKFNFIMLIEFHQTVQESEIHYLCSAADHIVGHDENVALCINVWRKQAAKRKVLGTKVSHTMATGRKRSNCSS